ncbi:MAG: hypothetical protein HWE24_10980 [Oceanospirillaceae bacterium]|nr:hypothetical protein [Oceanospirillaceae bacterium]
MKEELMKEEREAEYRAKLETLRQALQAGEDSEVSKLSHAQIIAKAKAELNG